jgi:hypothetical protein
MSEGRNQIILLNVLSEELLGYTEFILVQLCREPLQNLFQEPITSEQ